METNLKLYQILEKASIDTKIAVEIQDWIEDSLERNRSTAMFQIEESKFLPLQNDLKKDIQTLRSEMKFEIKSVASDVMVLRMEMQQNVKSLESDIQTLRAEMQQNVKSLESDLQSLRAEMQQNVKSLESDIQALRAEMQQNVKSLESDIQSIRIEMKALRTEMELRFQSLQTQMNQGFQSLNFTIRLLGVPIIGATLSALGLIFIKIWETIH